MQYMYTQLHWNKSTKDWLVWSHNNATKCVELYGNLQTVSVFPEVRRTCDNVQ